MATSAGKQGKRQDESSLGSLVDLVLANARVVLGVSGAAVLALATLAVKRVRPTGPSLPQALARGSCLLLPAFC